MKTTIEHILRSDSSVIEHYAKAQRRWKEIRASKDFENIETLARRLSDEQLIFEAECGGRWFGQEIMVVTGFAQFYSTSTGFEGYEESAKRVFEAFKRSYCSLEVKYQADEVAKYYGVTTL